jgi:hypothetical protein
MTLRQLGEWMADGDVNSRRWAEGMAEFTIRQTESQLKANEAQITAATAEADAAKAASIAAQAETEAANAGVKTAEATQLSAKHMRRSVVVAVISLLLACVAATASSIQSYVSWQGRNDLLRSTLIADGFKSCGEVVKYGGLAGAHYGVVSGNPRGALALGYMLKGFEDMVSYMSNTYAVISVATALGVPETDAYSKEYYSLASEVMDHSRKMANVHTADEDSKAILDFIEFFNKKFPENVGHIKYLCEEIRTRARGDEDVSLISRLKSLL